MRCWLNLRYTMTARRHLFSDGLRRLGYKIEHGVPHSGFGDKDILVTWNRISQTNKWAERFISRGQSVLVTENASWGNDFAGSHWLTIGRNHHNTAGCFPVGDSDRWDSLGVDMQPFRASGETVILAQRGIGSAPTAMPVDWAKKAQARHGGRIRLHPGKRESRPLEHDLQHCGKVVTWGSGAAIKALIMGIPVVSEMPNWIGEQDNTEAGRLGMLRRLAWAQWRHDEIKSGYAFERLL